MGIGPIWDTRPGATRERIAALSAAILRTSASLDLAAVLGEAGAVREFVTSGFTEAEHRQFIEWPDGPKLFVHLRDRPGPARLTDLPALVRSLGFSPDLVRSKTF